MGFNGLIKFSKKSFGKFVQIVLIVIISLFFSKVNSAQQDLTSSPKYAPTTLRSIIEYNVGASTNYISHDAGLFFAVSDDYLLGIKGNFLTEKNIFATSIKSLLSIYGEGSYSKVLFDRIIIHTGIGAGISFIKNQYTPVSVFNDPPRVEENNNAFLLAGEMEAGLLITRNIGISLGTHLLFTDNNYHIQYKLGIFLCKLAP